MTRRPGTSIMANPVLVGAITVLVVTVAVFLAYNANSGLPFVPTRTVHVHISNGANLLPGNDVREGGYRIGIVDDMKPLRLANGDVGADLVLKLDKKAGSIPVDSTIDLRPRSVLGLKYVELTRGRSNRTIPDGGALPPDQATYPVELDQLYGIFDAKTRRSSQTNLQELGNTFATRGASLNNAIAGLPRFVTHLRGVMRTLAEPEVNLERFFKELGDAVRIIRPVAGRYAHSFTAGADAFEAWSRDPEALAQTIQKSAPTLEVGTRSLRAQRPFLTHFARASRALRRVADRVPATLPVITPALETGARVQRRAVTLNEELGKTLDSLGKLVRDPQTTVALRGLQDTTRILNPLLRFVGPYITVCNYFNYAWTHAGEHVTEPDADGHVAALAAEPGLAHRQPAGLEPRHARRAHAGQRRGRADGRADEPPRQQLLGGRRRPGQRRLRVRPARLHAARGDVPPEEPQHRRRPAHAGQPGPDVQRALARAAGPDLHTRPGVRPARSTGAGSVNRVVPEAVMKRRNFKAGAIVLALMAVGIYFGFTKANPFASHFVLNAAFDDVVTLKPGAPVRVAGVVVGKVTDVQQPPSGDRGATVRMEINDSGLPLHSDARLHLKPRIFLEGNMFVDLRPGTPGAKELKDGQTLPVTQTSSPVGFGQVLGALQKGTREDLQTVLDEYGKALKGGAKAINRSTEHWEGAYRDGAIVNDALRGQRTHDLSEYVDSAGVVAAALDRDPVALKDLVTNFAITADAFASEQDRLQTAVAILPQTLRRGYAAFGALNDAFPQARRLVAALRPAVRSSGPALDAQLPLLRELRGLLSKAELGGMSRELRRVVPDLVEMARGGVALQTQARRLASCQLNSVIPTAEAKIDDPAFPTTGKVYEEGVKWLPGIAGESRGFDANGQYVKTTVRGGLNLVYQFGDDRFFMTSRPLLGVNPPKSAQPPYRADVPCETQDAPDVQSKPAAAPQGHRISRSGERYEQRYSRAQSRALTWLRRQVKLEGLNKLLKVVSEPVEKADLRTIRSQALRAKR